MCSLAATSPRLCWTGQLTEQVLTASSCTCTAQRATSCVAARMGSGGTLSTIIKARWCDSPPDVCATTQMARKRKILISLEEYDFVFVGAGAAGCVVASCLAEHTSASIALIEAGDMDRDPFHAYS